MIKKLWFINNTNIKREAKLYMFTSIIDCYDLLGTSNV
jgi:hypothetical protein